jgi:hypothetical protein
MESLVLQINNRDLFVAWNEFVNSSTRELAEKKLDVVLNMLSR